MTRSWSEEGYAADDGNVDVALVNVSVSFWKTLNDFPYRSGSKIGAELVRKLSLIFMIEIAVCNNGIVFKCCTVGNIGNFCLITKSRFYKHFRPKKVDFFFILAPFLENFWANTYFYEPQSGHFSHCATSILQYEMGGRLLCLHTWFHPYNQYDKQ